MSTLADKVRFDVEGFGRFLAGLDEPQWSLDLRREAFEQFEAMKWPDRRSEDWMRSDLRPFKLDAYTLAGGGAVATSAPVRLVEGVDLAGQICTVDGVVTKQFHRSDVDGVVFSDLHTALLQHEGLVRSHLWSSFDSTVDRFSALHAATWQGGAFLYVPPGKTVDRPFHIHSAMTDGGYDAGHSLIVIDRDAEATVLYEKSSPRETDGGFHCGGLEIIVQPGGRVKFVKLQEWGLGVWNFAQQRARIDRDASIQWTIAAMGSRFSQVAQQVSLVGEGANSQVNGVMFTRENQQITYNTLQEHVSPNCRSDFLYKAALQDSSRTVWRGLIKVLPGAVKTDGYQRNDNLMLSNACRADSIPGLEIKADDVRCTHGSTSGRVDEELIFYARCRGFTHQEAVRMIVTGFFQQIFDRITIENVRVALGESIARQVRQYR